MLSWLPPLPGVRVPLIPCPPSWVGESHQSRACSGTSSAPAPPPRGLPEPAGAAGDLGHCQETSGVNSKRGSEAGRGRLPGDVGEAVVCGLLPALGPARFAWLIQAQGQPEPEWVGVGVLPEKGVRGIRAGGQWRGQRAAWCVIPANAVSSSP